VRVPELMRCEAPANSGEGRGVAQLLSGCGGLPVPSRGGAMDDA
jgi:hypothetical protein